MEQIVVDDELSSDAGFSELTHLYEHLLSRVQPDRRKRAGVFFTPQPIVRYMLRQIDASLREEFSMPLGLADEATWGEMRQRPPSAPLPGGVREGEPFVRLFDPAVGTGAFLLDAIDFIHATLASVWREGGLDEAAIVDRWNEYVPRQLLPRLWGMELIPAPCFLAGLHVALKLAMTGYRFREPGRVEIHLGNTLAGPTPARREAAYDVPFTVVLGNPPFSYLSENKSDWITSLVRGGGDHAGYMQVEGQKLAEKKTWLHDDYVKFIRYAQWRIETTGSGIAALVTNHGYLSNATFRILRQQLLRVFPRISVLDLHGNRKAREVSPDGMADENVFGLDQGIAVGIFRRPPGDVTPRVEHAELWGSRVAKLQCLNAGQVSDLSEHPTGQSETRSDQAADDSGQVENLSYVPRPPDFFFAPAAAATHAEYATAPAITELFARHATAPVTARDHFVVAFTREELKERIEAFRDLSIPDDEIRRCYFTRTRSPRYAAGDTRSWKLSAARKLLAALDDWEAFIQPCQYRPLDWRWVFWHPAMIDWPRHEVTSHFVSPKSKVQSPESKNAGNCGLGNSDSRPALIARRQLPPSEPATYFWATSALALDGIIRSDNRGSESLILVGEESLELAAYSYALFHSPTYRQRYAAGLRTDFPRVLMTRDRHLFTALALCGHQLIALHVRRPVQFDLAATASPCRPPGKSQLGAVAHRYPQYRGGRIWIREGQDIASVDDDAWQFRVGAHQVAHKWLADRRGRTLSDDDAVWYSIVLDIIQQTRTLAARIDALIAGHGGFPAAFS